MSEAVAAGPSAGALLREAREAAGLHVASLAVALKVPVRKLEALEDDRHDLLGDIVFVRALAASVCRTLKIDPQPILERLPQTVRPRLVPDTEGINAPFRPAGAAAPAGWLGQVSRPVALTVVALLLAALVLIFLPVAQRQAAAPATETNGEAQAPEPRAAVTAVPVEPEPVALPALQAEPQAASVAAPASAPAAPETPVAAAAPAATPVAAPAAAPVATAAASAPAPAASGLLVFRATGDSWIQVVDANGTTVLQRQLANGESASASGPLPLSVIIGSASATEVQVRGRPYNLGPVTRDNVARFQIK